MRFHIPFTISSLEKLKRKPILTRKILKYKKDSKLTFYLENSDSGIKREEYLNIVARSFLLSFILLYVIFTTVFGVLHVKLYYLMAFVLALSASLFIFFSQMVYPRIFFTRRQRNIEKNLVSALEDMRVQLSSGIPLFNVLVNISSSDYGELSMEFKKVVRKINVGIPQADVLEEIGEKNPSTFFRRTLWQISNGMKAGSDISNVIRDSIRLINEEQIIQIQNYGNKLNPLIMFYMLITIILPALAVTFLTIIASMVSLEKNLTIAMYISLFVFVTLIQIMFLGIIRSARPTLI